ncbi:MAG: substrate-binding domain-containing protein [Thermoguttaceae bacterium]
MSLLQPSQPAFVLKAPLPKYRAADALCQQLIDHLQTGGFSVGDPFLSDRQVMDATGRSRTAVRRALDQLQQEGWIQRRGGHGTFVGPRVLMAVADRLTPSSERRLARLAVVIAALGQLRYDWHSTLVLSGIDEVSLTEGVTLELLGDHHTNPGVLARRLMQSRPDVFVCLGPPLAHVTVIGEAGRLGIPCVLAGVRAPELSLPNVFESSVDASRMAVRHLIELGHRRIGYVQVTSTGWWTFDRREGYLRELEANGIEPDEGMVLWLPPEPTPEGFEAFRAYLARRKPTALLFGCCWAAAYMQRMTNAGQLRVPDDLSVVTFDQHPEVFHWLGGVRPTTVELPARPIGHLLASMARRLVEGQEVPMQSALPCPLVLGASTRAVS